jgi:hypothetical protein
MPTTVPPKSTPSQFSVLPDIGKLSYNTVVWQTLYHSKVTINEIEDIANRTIKYKEVNIYVEGLVTLPDGAPTIDAQMALIIRLLSEDGAELHYEGKGLGTVVVNAPGGTLKDVAWGPKTKVIDFQPLGASRSALVTWQCTTCLPVQENIGLGNRQTGPVLQFNEESSISYDEDGYSSITIKGTLEIPLTRVRPGVRTLERTVDDFRQRFMLRVSDTIDLLRFRVTRRDFNFSRDKRTMEWSFAAEELPRMGLPPFAMGARGQMSVRNWKESPAVGPKWKCQLSITYAIRKDVTPRQAYAAFISFLNFRMKSSEGVKATEIKEVREPAGRLNERAFGIPGIVKFVIQRGQEVNELKKARVITNCTSQLLAFGFDEGVHLDSRKITFHAVWFLVAPFSHMLQACGIWQFDSTGEGGFASAVGGNFWKATVKDISGWKSWLQNRLDPTADIIVDFGLDNA